MLADRRRQRLAGGTRCSIFVQRGKYRQNVVVVPACDAVPLETDCGAPRVLTSYARRQAGSGSHLNAAPPISSALKRTTQMEGAPRRTPHFVHKLVNGRPSITSPLKPVSLPSLLHVLIVSCFSGTVKRRLFQCADWLRANRNPYNPARTSSGRAGLHILLMLVWFNNNADCREGLFMISYSC